MFYMYLESNGYADTYIPPPNTTQVSRVYCTCNQQAQGESKTTVTGHAHRR